MLSILNAVHPGPFIFINVLEYIVEVVKVIVTPAYGVSAVLIELLIAEINEDSVYDDALILQSI